MDGEENLKARMEAVLPQENVALVKKVGAFADRLNIGIYLVGGIVRDIILGVTGSDLDIVVEGNGLFFARYLSEAFSARLSIYERFRTASVYFQEGLKIDVASARTEVYPYPAALPIVKNGSLKQDLFRRDFTINAMALGINQSNFGRLIDFFSGKFDLEQKSIRVLHKKSFLEDPTRIIRAVRFEQRYKFTIEPQTLYLAYQAINNKMIEELSSARLKEELVLLIEEADPAPSLERLVDLGIWEQIFPETSFTEEIKSFFREATVVLKEMRIFFPKIDKLLYYLIILCADLSEQEIGQIVNRMQFPKNYERIINHTGHIKRKFFVGQGLAASLEIPSAWHNFLGSLPGESISYLYLISKNENREKIKNYLAIRKTVVMETTGKDLMNFGLKPGPKYRKLLDVILAARLDGLVHNKEDEIKLILRMVANERNG
ncbi:MAG: CCA tRNA nucleotidyltransferase [Bacillota bacterium]|jgi:tRNA nucleotidyltransferase (CCA-adding enzyme)